MGWGGGALARVDTESSGALKRVFQLLSVVTESSGEISRNAIIFYLFQSHSACWGGVLWVVISVASNICLHAPRAVEEISREISWDDTSILKN